MTEPTIAPDTRIRAFDLARGVAIVWMIMVHSVAHYGNDASWASPFTQVLIAVAGSTGAPALTLPAIPHIRRPALEARRAPGRGPTPARAPCR